MKKKIIFLISILTLILVLFVSGVIAYQKITKDNNNSLVDDDNKITYTKPTDPYGYGYLNDWQKELYQLFEDNTLEIGSDYDLSEERKLEDVQTVIDLYYQNNPNRLPKTYGAIENEISIKIEGGMTSYKGLGTANRIHIGQWLNSDMNKEKEKLSEIDKKANEIVSLIPTSATDYEKIKIIYDYFIENIEYDYENYEWLESGKANDDFTDTSTAYGALIYNKAICAGIAKAFHYVANKADVYVLYVESVSRNHAWNIVWLDGKYYRVDATWREFLTKFDYVGNFVDGIPLPNTNNAY